MLKVFNSIGHFFAYILSKVVPEVEKDLTVIQGAVGSDLAKYIVTLAGQKGATVQSDMAAIVGDVLNAVESAGGAVAAKGMNIAFDTATVESIKTLYNDVKGALEGKSLPPLKG